MPKISRNFLAAPGLFAKNKPLVELAVFGKHPAIPGFFERGLARGSSLEQAYGVLSTEGFDANYEDWKQLEAEARIDFDHVFVWTRGDAWISGVMMDSRDSAGRGGFPLVFCAEFQNVSRHAAVGKLNVAFRKLKESLDGALGSKEIGSDSVASSLKEIDTIAKAQRSQMLEQFGEATLQNGSGVPPYRVVTEFLNSKVWDADKTQLKRLAHIMAREFSPASKDLSWHADEQFFRPYRVPAAVDGEWQSLLMWDYWLRNWINPDIPLLLVRSRQSGHVDILPGNPSVEALGCFRKSIKAQGFTTDRPVDISPAVEAEVAAVLGKLSSSRATTIRPVPVEDLMGAREAAAASSSAETAPKTASERKPSTSSAPSDSHAESKGQAPWAKWAAVAAVVIVAGLVGMRSLRPSATTGNGTNQTVVATPSNTQPQGTISTAQTSLDSRGLDIVLQSVNGALASLPNQAIAAALVEWTKASNGLLRWRTNALLSAKVNVEFSNRVAAAALDLSKAGAALMARQVHIDRFKASIAVPSSAIVSEMAKSNLMALEQAWIALGVDKEPVTRDWAQASLAISNRVNELLAKETNDAARTNALSKLRADFAAITSQLTNRTIAGWAERIKGWQAQLIQIETNANRLGDLALSKSALEWRGFADKMLERAQAVAAAAATLDGWGKELDSLDASRLGQMTNQLMVFEKKWAQDPALVQKVAALLKRCVGRAAELKKQEMVLAAQADIKAAEDQVKVLRGEEATLVEDVRKGGDWTQLKQRVNDFRARALKQGQKEMADQALALLERIGKGVKWEALRKESATILGSAPTSRSQPLLQRAQDLFSDIQKNYPEFTGASELAGQLDRFIKSHGTAAVPVAPTVSTPIMGDRVTNGLGLVFIRQQLGGPEQTKSIWVATRETSIKDYRDVMGSISANAAVYLRSLSEMHPIFSVSPDEANMFCKKLEEKESGLMAGRRMSYRLPTESEFQELMEKNPQKDPFTPLSEDAKPVSDAPRAVNTNGDAIYDLWGNVGEICLRGRKYFARGGSFKRFKQEFGPSFGLFRESNNYVSDTGFRVVAEEVKP